MTNSHATCSHAATKAARAKCRRSGGPAAVPAAAPAIVSDYNQMIVIFNATEENCIHCDAEIWATDEAVYVDARWLTDTNAAPYCAGTYDNHEPAL